VAPARESRSCCPLPSSRQTPPCVSGVPPSLLPELHWRPPARPRADHRIHHAHPSKRAGPEDGPQLLLEQLRVLQQRRIARKPRNGLVPSWWVSPGNALQRFVAAQVERANDHGVGRKGRDDRPVARKLLVFAGQSRGIQVEILRAERVRRPLPASPAPNCSPPPFPGRQQDDVHAVQRFRRQAAGAPAGATSKVFFSVESGHSGTASARWD